MRWRRKGLRSDCKRIKKELRKDTMPWWKIMRQNLEKNLLKEKKM